jgi:hypothetical protein
MFSSNSSIRRMRICLWMGMTLATAFRSFAADPELAAAANHNLSIPKAVLGKPFLLSASIIPQSSAATSSGLAGKVVRFELFHDGVDLYEATDGLVVTKELPARRLLTTFPIVQADDSQVIIDFNKGMRRVSADYALSGSMAARDYVLEVPQSRVFDMQKQENFLVIRQSVQARSLGSSPDLEERYEIRYFLSPYLPSKTVGKEQPQVETRYARFFETAPVIEETTGRHSSKMARFDLSKPVDFYYSANTPKEYEQAVKDGILYWNRAFGKEVIRVQKAPEGVTAPDARFNLVQWVPWDGAGVAYADILLDPQTGESKHGQAYMTSVFAISGKARARAVLRMILETTGDKKSDKKEGDPKDPKLPVSVPFLEPSGACQINFGEFARQYAQGLEELLASDSLTDEAVLRVAQDYVREVAAHEVGHVLGLRHNFAGSLEGTLSHKELDDWFKAYLINKGLEGYTNKLSSASIMDYNPFKSSIFIGWKLRTSTNALPHDRNAIQWGYFDNKEVVEKKQLFGTDGDVGRYSDVSRFDYGVEPVVSAYGELSAALRSLPNTLIELFIAARAPRDPRDRIPLEQVNLNPKGSATAIANNFARILTWFRANARSVRIENQFDFIGELNEKERAQAHWKSLNEQVEHLGGLDRAAFSFLPLDLKLELKDEPKEVPAAEKISAEKLAAKVEKLLATPAYTNFVGLDEKKYSFTKDEKELIVKRSRRFFEEFEKEVVKLVCQRLEDAPRNLGFEATGSIGDEDLVAKLDRRVIDLARAVILAKEDDKHRLEGKYEKGIIQVVEFKYDDETRLAAAKALNDRTGSFRGWSVDAKSDLNKSLKDDVEGALNIGNLKEFKDASLSRPLREWYLKQQDILNLLPAKAR